MLSTQSINTHDVEEVLTSNLDKFPVGAHFTIFAGSHGCPDGTFGKTTLQEQGSMLNEYRKMMTRIKD